MTNLLAERPAATLSTVGYDAFVAVESIPGLCEERRLAAQEAAAILGRNRDLLRTGQAEDVPTPVDALGTAHQVIDIKQRFGAASPEYQEAFTGLVLDSERLLAEAYTKNTAEYFGKVLQNFDAGQGQYFAHGLSISRMVENGLSPSAELEEQDRRVNELVEERTYEAIGKAIGRVGLQGMVDKAGAVLPAEQPATGSNLHVTTVSECTDYAIRDYKLNSKASHGGYAPAVEKLMIRRVHFADGSGDRQEEQVALPGLYITHDLIEKVVAEKTGLAQARGKTELHGSQFVGVDGGGVMDFVRELDLAASQESGQNIFMGEVVPADHPKNYQVFMAEAEIRRQKLAPKPTELANYLIELEEADTSSRVATGLVDKWLKKTLLEVASQHPELAEAMFDEETADGFREVARLKALGEHNRARQLQIEVEQNAPEVSYCGAGSCGLEAVPGNSPEARAAQQLGLTGDLVRDTERPCPGCGEMTVIYDANASKACVGCGETELH